MSTEDVKVKMSTCQTCQGVVRAAIEHKMNVKSKNSFAKEVMEHNLSVTSITLLEYKKGVAFCECPLQSKKGPLGLPPKSAIDTRGSAK